MSTTTTQAQAGGSSTGRFSDFVRSAPQLGSAEVDLIRVVVEQVSVRSDQLVRLLEIDADRLDALLAGLVARGWLRRRRLFAGEAEWVSASSPACRLFGVRFVRWEMRSLDHRYYVNEVRLQFAASAPEGLWISERFLRSGAGRSAGGEVPDGVVDVGGVRWGVEVELSPKPVASLRGALRSKACAHDLVAYFCGERTFEKVSLEVAFLGLSNVVVRMLGCPAPRRRLRLPRACRGPATSQELAAARIVSEQGAVRVDQLGRFLSISGEEAEAIAALCWGLGTLGRRPGLVGEADWLWTRARGARLADNGLAPFKGVSPAIFVRAAMVNELRLRAQESEPAGCWESSRAYSLAARAGRSGGGVVSGPDGVLHRSDGSRTAYLVVSVGASNPGLRRRVRRWGTEFDWLVCVASPRTAGALAGYVVRMGLSGVSVEDYSGRVVHASRSVGRYGFRRSVPARGPRCRSVDPLVREVVVLCAEEGLLDRGQLGALAGCSAVQVDDALGAAVALGFLRDDLCNRFGWQLFVATQPGCDFSETGLRAESPRAAGRAVGRADVLVQARIELSAGVAGTRWASCRRLSKGGRHRGAVRWGLLERGEEVVGVAVQLNPPIPSRGRVVRGLEAARHGCDGLIVYCTERARPGMEKLVASEGWSGVELRAVSLEIEALCANGAAG